jgi:hypothetical protein
MHALVVLNIDLQRRRLISGHKRRSIEKGCMLFDPFDGNTDEDRDKGEKLGDSISSKQRAVLANEDGGKERDGRSKDHGKIERPPALEKEPAELQRWRNNVQRAKSTTNRGMSQRSQESTEIKPAPLQRSQTSSCCAAQCCSCPGMNVFLHCMHAHIDTCPIKALTTRDFLLVLGIMTISIGWHSRMERYWAQRTCCGFFLHVLSVVFLHLGMRLHASYFSKLGRNVLAIKSWQHVFHVTLPLLTGLLAGGFEMGCNKISDGKTAAWEQAWTNAGL